MIRFFHCFRVNTKAMILRGDLAFTGDQVFNRVIQSAVTMMHFKGRNIIGQGQQLVAQANAKDGLSSFRIFFTV